MSKILYGIVILLIALFGVAFAVLNAEAVQFDYYFGKIATPFSLALILALLVGAIFGLLASAGIILRAKRQVAKLKRASAVSEKEIANLRAIPIKNQH